MNIIYPALFKAHDIVDLKLPQSGGMVDQNFDRIVQNFRALQRYKIDLANDVNTSTYLALERLFGVDEDITTQFLRRDATWGTVSTGFVPSPVTRMWAMSVVDVGSRRDVGVVLTSSGSTAQQVDDAGVFVRHTTGAVSGNAAAITSSTLWRLNHNPKVQFHIRTGNDISSIRLWFGIIDAATANFANSDSLGGGGTAKGAAFRYSTVAGDAGWIGVARDGTTQTTTTATSAIAADTIYRLEISIEDNASNAVFSINDVELETLALGSGALGVNANSEGRVITQAAATRRFDFGRFYYERD